MEEAMAETRLADISEFQANIDAPQYLTSSKCLIVRAHNGYRPDNKWPARRDYLRGFPFTALGWYQYLAKGRDAATQAREFIAAVGALKENEFVILDHEEGLGNQTPRAEAWFAVVDKHYGFPASLYAGAYFGNANLGGWARWKRPRWIAAYQAGEPSYPHEWWQYTDAARFPGLAGGVDGSLFHGTDIEFLHKVRPGAAAPPADGGVSNMAILGTSTAVLNKDGRAEEFVVVGSGVSHRWQTKPGGSWSDWSSFGAP